jgi:hypothetical protein
LPSSKSLKKIKKKKKVSLHSTGVIAMEGESKHRNPNKNMKKSGFPFPHS